MLNKYFLAQVKRTNGTVEKGVVVKDTLGDCEQSFHAYLGAYGFGHDPNTDYVLCQIIDASGAVLANRVDDRTGQEEV